MYKIQFEINKISEQKLIILTVYECISCMYDSWVFDIKVLSKLYTVRLAIASDEFFQ